MSDSVRPHRWQPTRLCCPWDSPGKNTGVGCHFLLQCMKVKSGSEVTQSCLTLHNPMDWSLPGSSFHGIFQARVLEWVAIAFSWWLLNGRYSFLPKFPQHSTISGDLQSLLTVTSFLCWYGWKYPFSHSAWPEMNRYLEKDFDIQSYDKVTSLSSDHMLSDHMTRQPKGRGPYVQ